MNDLRSGLEALEQRTLLSASPVFELSDLLAANGGNGSEGVVINGVSLGDRAGVSVSSAGDINGDGFDDVIIGAFRDAPNGVDSGASFVVFGKAGGFSATQQLASLNGTNGFKINGINAGDFSGRSVAAAGDINGDGFDDLLIGSFVASPNGAESGQVHVVYGHAGAFTPTLELSSLNGTNGFTINGVSAGDQLGFSVRGAGDVNGDGLDDFILGASLASPNGASSGSAYLVFGQSGFGSSFDLATLNGSNGFRIDGVSADDQLGISANGAGDINGDGLADLIVGAFQDDPNGGDSGAAFVIFGATGGFSSTFNPATLNGTNGFTINGGAALDNAGRSVDSAGDFNGDGFADLLIGAPEADGSTADSGSAYVVFGHSGAFVSSLNLATLNGANGFKLNGIDTGDRTGLSVSNAGDVNGDGLDDILVAADRANPGGFRSGETYLVFGRSTAMPASINLSALNGADGFVLRGISTRDSAGSAIRAAGDVNGDGYGDFIIGAFLADPNGGESGQSYLVFGGDFSDAVTHQGSSSGDALVGTAGADIMVAGRGDDLVTGNGGADVLIAGQGDDEITIKDTTFKRIAGGNGTDTLKLIGTGIDLDLTAIADSRLTGIERIDISAGANTLTLNQREVLNLSDSSNTLTVTVNISGNVNMGAGWTQTDSQIVNGNQQTTYTQGQATLIIVELADVIDPVVTINPLKTESRSPELSGTVADLDPNVTIAVTVGGNTYNATNNGDGTWTLPAGTISPDLADGVYSVLVVGTDSSGNDGNDQTANELVIDNAAPVVTIDALASNSTSPQLTGTVTDVDPATTISVTVNGNTYNATNNGDGTWTLAAGVIGPALADGVYDVSVTGTDTLGHIGTDASSDELTIDTTAPLVTIDAPGTKNSGSPELTGTVTDADLATLVEVAVNGNVYEATNNGDGTWTLAAGVIDPVLAEGSYSVDVRATDTAGNQTLIDEAVDLEIDGPPVVTVNPLTTSDQTPQLTGTITDADTTASIVVTINGIDYTAINHGDGTWTLPNDTILPGNALAPGTYNVTVTATDSGNNVGTDDTTDELIIDTSAPTVTIDTLTTSDTTPTLTGTVSDASAVIKVTVNSIEFTATNNGDGTWTLADNTITPALSDGVYDVSVSATNQAQIPAVGTDNTTDELRIDTANPAVTVNTRVTADTTPSLSGTIQDADPDTTITVTVNAIQFDAVNNGDGTWTLPDNTITPALAIGTYDIIVTALDSAGNVDVATAIGGLEITDAPFTITVDPLATNDPTPQLSGTITDATAQVVVTINGTPYAAVNNGDGTWTLADNAITTPLADGVYEVLAQGTIAGPVTLSDDTTDELTVDLTAPVVTVDPLNTSDTNPQLTGTVDDASATVSVTVNGNVYAATNNGDGTWTLADNAITPLLPVGTYNVQATATDVVGNVGADVTIDELIITAPIVPSIDLDDLHASNGGDGTQGTVFNGVAGGDWAGNSASSAGDINGDGFDDLVIGANNADPIDNNDGTVYIVFGRADGFPAEFDLASLDGTNGFKINAQASRDSLGVSVASAGDVNGDGIDDLVIGADLADPNGSRSGSAYVIYGKTTAFSATLDLSTLDGTNGYKFNGTAAGDRTGFSVNSAGDINGDGLADVVIGTLAADNGVVIDTGRAYVIYGSSAAMPAVLTPASLNGTNGFILTGPDIDGQAGFSVSTAGDINGDGIADLRIGAPGSMVGGNAGAGKTFVVFGNTSGFGTELNLSTLNGTNGFIIEGNAADMGMGFSGSAIGDFNGDGIADLLVSAPASADPNSAGSAFVIFGHTGAFPATLSVGSLDGTNGFALQGVDNGDETGFNVSGVGDVNGDGFDDLLIGAHMAAGGTFENGESYLLFGRAGAFAASINLSTIPGNGGMVLNGAGVLDHSGRYVSMAGDVNGDGYADFLVTARDADINGNNDAGRTYLIYGRDFTGTVTQVGGATDNTLTGSAARDAVIAGAGNDTIVGNGGPDVQSGGQGDDTLAISDTAFKRLSGGNGFDTLRLDGAGVSLDLTAINDSRITGIEQIDVRGSGANSLTLNAQEVLNLSDTSNTLLILSDSGDTVDIGTGWTAQGQEEIGGKNFAVLTQGNATLKLYIESTQITGDLSGDGFVGIADLNIILGNWNQNVTAGVWAEGDPSGDGFVGIADLNAVLGNWNAGTPPVAEVSAPAASAPVQSEPASTQQAAPAPAAQTADPLDREASILDQVATTSQAKPQAQQRQQRQQAQSQSSWNWMQDASRTQRSAFGDSADSDSALDLAQPVDSAISRLLN